MIDSNDPFEQGGGEDSGLGAFGAAPAPKKRISQQTVLLAGIIVVGGGLLFGMRKFGMGPGLSFADVSVDYQPGQENSELAAEYERVMALLDRSSEPTQVPAQRLARDPFVLAAREMVVEQAAEDPNDPAIAMARLRAEVSDAASRIKIQSVMGGRVPLVRIGDRTLKAGEEFNEWLTFEGVDGRSVRFIGIDGRYYIGSIGESLSVEDE
ncbi:MAG: hypothetical protein AAGG07_10710 [Planctomycetota bacterium]